MRILSFLLLISGLLSTGVGAHAAKNLLTGEEINITADAGTKATVWIFLSSKCPCSTSHEPALKELHKKFKTKGFRFLGVHSNADEDLKPAQRHFTQAQLPFPIIQDSDSAIANRFGALKTPHVFVVNASDEILFQGGVDDSHDPANAKKFYLADALTALSQGKSPPVREARALGCVIAR